MTKPRPIEFLLRGYELAECLELIDRWDHLTDAERRHIMAPRSWPLLPKPVAEKLTRQ